MEVKMYRSIKKIILSSTLLFSLSGFAKTEIDFWSFTRAFDPFLEQFAEDHPDIKVNFTVIPYNQYPQKIMASLRSAKTAPTLFVSEVSWMNQFVEQDIWQSLDEMEAFKDQKENFIPYVWNAAINKKGELVAGTWQANPLAFMYNRNIAKEILGTDDHNEISSKMDSFESILEVLQTEKEKTGNSYYVFWGDTALAAIMQAKHQQPFVKDGVLTEGDMINELFGRYIDFTKVNAIIYPETDDPFFKAVEQGKVFGIYTAPWLLGSKLKPYRPDDSGKWGIATSPYPAIIGGTWVGIAATEKDPKKLAAAETLLGDLLTNIETSQAFIQHRGDVPTNKIIYENLKENRDEYLGNQRIIEAFSQNLNEAKLFKTPYDAQVRTSIQNVLEKIITNPENWTMEKAVEEYKKQAALNMPDIIVP